jgi:hypothetical protein
MKNIDPLVIGGTLFMIKQEGQFKVAFFPGRYVLNPRKEDFFPGNERAISRMLYRNGLVDEPQLFELVKEGREEIILDIYTATLISAIVLGLPEEPSSIEDIEAKIAHDAAKKQTFEALSAHFMEPDSSEKLLQVRVTAQYPRYLDDRNVG